MICFAELRLYILSLLADYWDNDIKLGVCLMVHPLLKLRMVMCLRCPYCNIDYYSPETFNIHIQGCYYKDCSQAAKTELESLTYQELKDRALSKGIKAGNMKKAEIIKVLREMEE